MEKDVRIIANYLPQYHTIPENDMWWGKGFTDWCAVKNAKPMYSDHKQPKCPLNNNYYSLDNKEAIKWQADLAREYGVYGFGIYHYWFSSELQLLQTPAELILNNTDIDINFMFIWDNLTWKRTWSKISRGLDWAPNYDEKQNSDIDSGILAELDYGNEEDWKRHFDYLLPFFKDNRYIKINNKPMFSFFQPRNDIETIKKMVSCWNRLAIENGFAGIMFLSKESVWPEKLEYQMRYAPFAPTTKKNFIKYKLKDYYAKVFKKIGFYSYDQCWKTIISEAKKSNNSSYLCGFVSYDDSPRRGEKGRIITKSTPDKFQKYMSELITIAKDQRKEFVFLMAWNEWGEGAYLEPDIQHNFEYLEALRRAIEEGNQGRNV